MNNINENYVCNENSFNWTGGCTVSSESFLICCPTLFLMINTNIFLKSLNHFLVGQDLINHLIFVFVGFYVYLSQNNAISA